MQRWIKCDNTLLLRKSSLLKEKVGWLARAGYQGINAIAQLDSRAEQSRAASMSSEIVVDDGATSCTVYGYLRRHH